MLVLVQVRTTSRPARSVLGKTRCARNHSRRRKLALVLDVREDVYYGRFLAAAHRQEARLAGHKHQMQPRQQWRGEDSVSVAAAAFRTGEERVGQMSMELHVEAHTPHGARRRSFILVSCPSS